MFLSSKLGCGEKGGKEGLAFQERENMVNSFYRTIRRGMIQFASSLISDSSARSYIPLGYKKKKRE